MYYDMLKLLQDMDAMILNTDKFIADNFDTAVNIYSVCDKLGLADGDARLYTYIHFKISSNNRKDYFEGDNSREIKALEILLNKDSQARPHSPKVVDIQNGVKQLDNKLRENHGMETRVSSELNKRLQLYKDADFRKRALHTYFSEILPELRNMKNVA